MTPPLQLVVAERRNDARRRLVGLLRAGCPDWTFGEAASLAAATAQLDDGAAAGLLLVDLSLLGLTGAGIGLLRASYPALKIAVLGAPDRREVILGCLAAGAHGFLPRDDAPERILCAARRVAAGEVYVPPQLALLAPAPPGAALPAGLTGRQREVLLLLADGQSTKAIAHSLNLGLGTIKVHLNGVYQRLGARNRAEAVARFRGAGHARARPDLSAP